MSASETAATRTPSRGLLIAFAVVVVAALVYLVWPAATPQAPPSNQSKAARAQQQAARTAGTLDVRLDALKQPPPQPTNAERNPFRFQPKAPPPSPLQGRSGGAGSVPQGRVGPPPPPSPPPIPPIPLKFIGTVEGRGPGKIAIFVGADGKGAPVYGREGQLVLGQYRIVKIGIESVVMEYADGRGRQTIPLRG